MGSQDIRLAAIIRQLERLNVEVDELKGQIVAARNALEAATGATKPECQRILDDLNNKEKQLYARLATLEAALAAPPPPLEASAQPGAREESSPKRAKTESSANARRQRILSGLQLLAATLLAVNLSDNVITVSADTVSSDLLALLPPILRTSIFVRPWYRRLAERILLLKGGTVVAGTPGTGKSAFMLFLLHRLAHLHCKIVLKMFDDVVAEHVIVFMDFVDHNNVVVDYIVGDLKALPAYKSLKIDNDTWVLSDGPPPARAQYSESAPSVYFSSPQEGNFKDFCRGKNARVLYMRTWDLVELEECRELLYKEVDPEVMRQRYKDFGGVIRPVLVRQEDTVEDLLQLAVGEDAERLRNLHLLSIRQQTIHRLVHLKVASNLTSVSYMLASPRIAEMIFKQAMHVQQDNVQKLLAAAGSNSNLGGLPGMMFEQHGHAVMPIGGKVRMRRLEQRAAQPAAQPEEEEEDEDDDDMLSHHDAEDLPGFGFPATNMQQPQDIRVEARSASVCWDTPGFQLSSRTQMYLRPITVNNAAWDAYYVDGQRKWLLQYTMSARHGVNAKAVQSFLQRLPPQVQGEVYMVFIVPSDQYDRFAWQPWLGARSRVLQRVPAKLRDMQQWVMQLPMAPTSRRASESDS
mmetsp:Transcript_2684/g.5925  ORF Transcript_2684/g.5925 Transcript_2684/m.5925 type:complete len:635 (-) Transcript_2684:951-2855(-)